eukprot:gnl/TRDRNA2_/TRDRNA2_146747_c0_seq1.p2 gnl/TRDRNA2_/TRDRNA2_146747_c0~~gnl/TRDRNA2_/TRDRNA2_146747_c0_seq1.p2  ORF type:complete len:110 (+),score=17.28 gnl/TRDRNA2_/TRDRNA2_146747_c0_seq1:1-330(+)
MKQISKRLSTFQVDYRHEIFERDPSALDFCSRLLDKDENARLSAAEALQHPFIGGGDRDFGMMHSVTSTTSKAALDSPTPLTSTTSRCVDGVRLMIAGLCSPQNYTQVR